MNRIKAALKEFAISLKKNDGMTLIEIMIVVAIIAILSAVVVPRFLNAPKTARVTSAQQQIKIFETALLQYSLDNGRFPSTDDGLQALVSEGYIQKIPNDPWEHPYNYLSPGEHDSDYDIWSYGADGQEGGEGFNADITSWQ